VRITYLATLLGAVAVLQGCGGNSSTGVAPDKFVPIYGVWIGALSQQDQSQPSVWYTVDSVQVTVSPNGSSPTAQLRMRPFGHVGWESHSWRDVPFQVTGPVTENWDLGWQNYDCSFEARCDADTVNDLPASRWWGGHYVEGHNNRVHFTVLWPGLADSVGEVSLIRKID
jgi:hypothetical protein